MPLWRWQVHKSRRSKVFRTDQKAEGRPQAALTTQQFVSLPVIDGQLVDISGNGSTALIVPVDLDVQ
jgi:hypothetical protein